MSGSAGVDATPSDPVHELSRLEGVPSAMAAALAAVDGVLTDRGLRRIEPADVAAAAWRAARAAVTLSGEALSGEALSGEAGPAAGEAEADAPLAVATLRMLAEVPAVAEIVRQSPAQALARLHTVWGHGLVPDDELGMVRTDAGVADRLAALLQLLTSDPDAPVITLAGIVHAELWTLRPFEQGSWAVALGAEQAILISAGVDPRGVIPVAAGHLEAGGHPGGLAGFTAGTADGMRRWLLHQAAAVARAAELCPLNPAT